MSDILIVKAKDGIKEAYGLSEYTDKIIKALEQRSERVMSDKRCCISRDCKEEKE